VPDSWPNLRYIREERMNPIVLNILISTLWDLVTSNDNDLSADEVKKTVKKNLGDNMDAKEILTTAVIELGKKL
jgi:hypothetical protein